MGLCWCGLRMGRGGGGYLGQSFSNSRGQSAKLAGPVAPRIRTIRPIRLEKAEECFREAWYVAAWRGRMYCCVPTMNRVAFKATASNPRNWSSGTQTYRSAMSRLTRISVVPPLAK